MRINCLTIHNYRSIKHISLDCGDLVALLGPNNHGKSNVLSALEFALSTSAKPKPEDFFAYREDNDDTMWVELTFGALTKQEANTLRRYVLFDNTVCIRKTATQGDESIEFSYNGWTEQPDEEWLRPDAAGNYASRDKINATKLKDYVPESGRVTKADVQKAQEAYIESHAGGIAFTRTLESGPLLGQKNVGGGVLPEFFLVPAVRDLTEEIKLKTSTTFGRLMNRAVREMAERDPRFSAAREQLQTVINSLNERGETEEEQGNELATLERSLERELGSWGVRVNIEVTPPELERLFELGTDVHLDDGVKTTADRKGHGLQRAMIFALLRSWASALTVERADGDEQVTARKQSDSIIFAMEEPELFLHPHAQRRLSSSLREIADTPDHQVLLCTHSTHFVDLRRYKEIAIISKAAAVEGSAVRQCTEELFEGEGLADRKNRFHMEQWINPDRGEMFFARRVVLVEGETETVMLPYIAQRLDANDPDVSIIECGSKHSLPLYIAIVKAFKIPYVVVHDEDPLPDPIPGDGSDDKRRERERTYALNKQIEELTEAPLGWVEVMEQDFEHVAGVSRTQGKTKGKALAALEQYEQFGTDGIPDRLKALVSAIYGPDSA